jgi:uncharacterized RDD family membrane protein YckC
MSTADFQPKTRKLARAARRSAAARLMPPEGVPLTLDIAGVGVRMAAQITDILITFAFAVSILILFGMTGLVTFSTVVGLGSLLFFLIRVPYYILSELAWNGQTIGKRLMKIKVVSHTGGPLSTHALVLRNMMKEAEIFLPGTLLLTLNEPSSFASWLGFAWIVLAFAIPLMNPHCMRLGDMLAGTHVVHLPHPMLLADLARPQSDRTAATGKEFVFLSHQLDHYGRFELQTLETLLRAQEQNRGLKAHRQNQQTLAAIVERIRKKIGYADAVASDGHLAFLRAFYNAQRGHLEQRQVFGDLRSDKHHGKPGERTQD